jgi:pyruvate/2-oxoglutarate dehydrogenase complex dihydrolipoamide dehydrogenase (E3) component
VVIGGGQTGCETGLNLAFEGREVTIVEMVDHLALDAGFTYRNPLIERLKENVTSLTGARCKKITGRGVEIEKRNHDREEIQADTVIVAVGMRPKRMESEQFQDIAPEFFLIGDCEQVKNVKLAVRAGYYAAIQI